jgi:fatty acid desaturase
MKPLASEPTPPRQGFPGSPDLRGLATRDGERWERFAPTLVANYRRVALDIARCWFMLAAGLATHVWLALRLGDGAGFVAAPVVALWLGFWIDATQLLMHEAVHFNVHPDKVTNDRLAGWLLGPIVAEDVARYRAVHWLHHLHLGSPEDTEVSYHRPPTLRFLLQGLAGFPIVRVLTARVGAGAFPRQLPSARRGLVRAAILHCSIVAALVLAGRYSSALAWGMGLVNAYPFWGSLRQTLEHRAFDASPDVDYTRTAHGPVNRMFGKDLLSRMFGYAGFNRHLLHHWYPAASYTCFDTLEAFFMRTPLAAAIDAARTTYPEAFRRLRVPSGRPLAHSTRLEPGAS